MAKLKIGICGWGNVATGLYEQLVNGDEVYADWEISCIGARRDNPKCNPGSTKILRDIIEVVDEDIDVLVENKIEGQDKFFGRNEYFNSVIFNANENDIGKIVKVNIDNSNQNTLFGKIKNKMKAA